MQERTKRRRSKRASTAELALTAPIAIGRSRSAHPPEFSAGDVVAGRYQILRLVGQGGMGDVYEARDLELSERVALKTIRPSVELDDDVILRFKREIQLSRKVTHRNVCRIFDVGFHSEGDTAPRTPFLTMELLGGESLADLLRRKGRLRIPRALPLVEQIVAALDAAHAANIIHSDLKPANIMLVPRQPGQVPRVVVTDFGLARMPFLIDPSEESGEVLGSPPYISPEQLELDPITPSADIYALGVMLFEMATGDIPFRGPTAFETAMMRLDNPAPPATSVRSDVPEVWSDVTARCLQRHPEDRPASARAVLELLESREPPRAPGRRGAIAALAVSALLAGFAGMFSMRSDDHTSEPSVRAPAAPPRSPPSDPEAAAAYEAGMAALRTFDADTALTYFDKVIAIDNEHARTHIARAEALSMLERAREALGAIQRAQQLLDQQPEAEREELQAAICVYLRLKACAVQGYSALSRRYPYDLEIGLGLVYAQRVLLDWDAAHLTLERLRSLPPPDRNDPRLDLAEALVAKALGKYQAAFEAASTALIKGEHIKSEHVQAMARHIRAWGLFQLGRPALARKEAELAADALEHLGLRHALIETLGVIEEYEMTVGRFRNAERVAKRKLEIVAHIEGAKVRLLTHLGVAEAIVNLGQLDEAESIASTEILEFREVHDYYGEAVSHLIRGEIRHMRGELASAERDCQFAVTIGYGIQNERLTAWAYHELGRIQLSSGQLESATYSLKRAKDIRERLGLALRAAQTRGELARLAAARGHTDDAVAELSRVIADLTDMNAMDKEALSRIDLAMILIDARRLDEAKAVLDRAQELVDQGENVEHQLRLVLARASIAALEGDTKTHAAELRAAEKRAHEVGLGLVEAHIAELRNAHHIR